MKRCRVALSRYHYPETIILGLKLEADLLRKDCRSIITVLRDRLASFDEASAPAQFADHLHAHHLRSLGLALSTGVILNCNIHVLESESVYTCEESSQWSKEILELARVAIKYLPLGSLSMVLCLTIVWISATDAEIKETTLALLSDYERAYLGKGAIYWTAGLEGMRKRFILEQPCAIDRIRIGGCGN